MEEDRSRRPRAIVGSATINLLQSEATGARVVTGGPTSPNRSSRERTEAWTTSPTRRISGEDIPGEGIRRRSTAFSRRAGGGVPSLTARTSLAERTQGKFTMAGPDETPQLRTAHEPFVQPGYSDLNPSYDQPANTKPVWSLAKPLPRVVRPGMVPTKDELLQARANAQLPAENSQKLGLDVDPNELEQGRIDKTADPRKMAAQVKDARLQRETNFMNKILTGDTELLRQSSRLSRTSSVQRSRPPGWDIVVDDHLSIVPESDTHTEGEAQGQHELSDEYLQGGHEDSGSNPVLERPADKITKIPSLDEAAYPDDLHPLVQDLVEVEVHNNHTTWSVIRTHHREALAESLAVFVQLTIGFSADLAVTIAKAGNPNTTDWAWGFATMMAIYLSGGVSGAHLNPTITVMLWFYRGFPKRKMPEYFMAQFIGAFCAALAAYGIYYQSIHQCLISNANSSADIINSFVTSQRETWIDPATAFWNEFLGTAILTVVILALGDDQNAPPGAGMNSLIIGLVITCLSIAFAYQTGAAFNPSRDFGPRLALLALGYGKQLFTNPYWFYGPWAGSLSGSFLGAFLYDFMVFTGGESPVNYPLERTQRSLKKSRTKWERRLNVAREKMIDRISP
ncbi:MIP transporter [Talaromyces proteolyticus]|uniref:MIP transporter n=1 Tax=Talaromyces proteolyticus TaxID=1131652 RepID=A0AAD4KD13_9EURO|nr:MIP transporter [Talaromyces proteolyticus]KAH8688716.1 MIP transporter [Talaromyces proteolyticus]